MAKRKANSDQKKPSTDKMDVDTDESGSEDENELLNVDFEYFDPSPDVDFHGLKTLLRQLFDVDNQLFELSELADMILAQPLLGSTIKCDGNESDPYAFLTVLNMREHHSKKVIQQLTKYLLSRSNSQGAMGEQLQKLLSSNVDAQVGLILTERFVNMPHQTVPPMYNMLLEEMQWANDENEPYKFTHYLVVSKTYIEVTSQLDAEDDRPQKKSEKGGAEKAELFYFHPEDEVLHKHAIAHCNFDYEMQEAGNASDSKRAFQEMGVKPQGHLILLEAGRFEGAVKGVADYLADETET